MRLDAPYFGTGYSNQEIEEECIGLIFPVYMHRIPHIVTKFMLKIWKTDYIFVLAVNGSDPGRVFTDAKKILIKKQP